MAGERGGSGGCDAGARRRCGRGTAGGSTAVPKELWESTPRTAADTAPSSAAVVSPRRYAQCHHGGIVIEPGAEACQQVGEGGDGLRCGGRHAGGDVREQLLVAVPAGAGGGVRVGDAVGVEQQRVTGVQRDRGGGERGVGNHADDGSGGGGLVPDGPVTAQQQRRRVTAAGQGGGTPLRSIGPEDAENHCAVA